MSTVNVLGLEIKLGAEDLFKLFKLFHLIYRERYIASDEVEAFLDHLDF